MNLDLREVPFYYINLDRQPERKERMEELLSSLDIKNYSRVEATSHSNGFAGCARTVADFLKENKGPFVLLEDDIALKNWEPIIDIPDDADAFYLGISGWGRMNGHSGPCVQHEDMGDNIVRIRNMLSGHAVLYLTQEWIDMAQKACSFAGYEIESYYDVQVAEVMRFFNVYAFDDPYFYQTSSDGNQTVTYNKLSEQQSIEIFQPIKQLFLPERVN